MDKREIALIEWLKSHQPKDCHRLEKLADDASFRRYYRVHCDTKKPLVAMDAPPDKEGTGHFIAIARLLRAHGLQTPQIIHHSPSQGFILMGDLGDNLLLKVITPHNADALYTLAIETLISLQGVSRNKVVHVPPFDATHMQQELALFEQWYLKKHRCMSLSTQQKNTLDACFSVLVNQIACQPQVLIHRDYHSRNLMLVTEPSSNKPDIGILDFQDAMIGPYAYDLASLLKDCYIEWSDEKRLSWLEKYHQQTTMTETLSRLERDVDFCGMQRHLKVLGIFSRLAVRDGKTRYLNDLPLTLKYLTTAAEKYSEFDDFSELLKDLAP